ncbi:hypothetical protein BT96DRAFT_1009875 [Gymnopus androsaceus JB14]|uniref:Endonuclease/exonuclease/phosphatase domain-containing protein n=1 Tax=Gymnopus androsaceus JB14 TaxID=1447944 RepID=A0A6A4GBY5_9AGAR|nr:hypothetical protein BT96DRAFT_1009875 [Gymnopus androsaceus JB14]
MFVLSRGAPEDLRRPWGGVLAFVRKHIPATLNKELSSTDIMVLNVGPLILYNAYILPENSTSWTEFADKHPYDMLWQSLAAASVLNKPILILTDMNARTASRQMYGSLARSSQDTSNVSSRGSSFLKMGNDLELIILNGVQSMGPTSSQCTSFQPRGSSVIDYAIVNAQMLELVKGFAIGKHEPTWSDHAPTCSKTCLEPAS